MGSVKEAGIFLDIVLFISSGQQLQKYNLLLVWQNFGYAKNVGIFLGILKYESLSDPPSLKYPSGTLGNQP